MTPRPRAAAPAGLPLLEQIVAAKRRAHATAEPPPAGSSPLPPLRSLAARLLAPRTTTPHVIAEFKRRSPSAGWICAGADAASVAAGYVAAGATALSVLTDGEFFGGALVDLAAVRAATSSSGAPVLRKDFVLYEEEVAAARLAGADVVLLIVRLLDEARLRALLSAAAAQGLEALVEVHSEAECERALAAGARLIGVNHRDLDTLAIDLDLSARLAPRLPATVIRVAESGLRTRDDLRRMADRGYHAVLVGEALLRTADPAAALRALTGESA